VSYVALYRVYVQHARARVRAHANVWACHEIKSDKDIYRLRGITPIS